MAPESVTDRQAKEWFNKFFDKLQFGQDYIIYPGSSKILRNENGEQTGIAIKRPDVRLYGTGITKLYQMIVEGKELPTIEYTPEQEKQFYDEMIAKWPEVADDAGEQEDKQ